MTTDEDNYKKIVSFIETKYHHKFIKFTIVSGSSLLLQKNAKCDKCNSIYTLDIIVEKNYIPEGYHSWIYENKIYYRCHRHGGDSLDEKLFCEEVIIKKIIE